MGAEWSIEMLNSPNMVAAAAVFGKVIMESGKNDVDFNNLGHGEAFQYYALFLSFLYSFPGFVMAVTVIPTLICYFWVFVPAMMAAFALSWAAQPVLKWAIKRSHSQEQLLELNMEAIDGD